jgi:hypothetical protein
MAPKTKVLMIIRRTMNDVGSSLKEDALSDLIHLQGEGIEHGFRFLRLSDGFAVFGTPRQDRSKWYRRKGWLCPDKEATAASIASKYNLEISEPPDVDLGREDEMHHHCEFYRDGQTMVVAHPSYLKVRISQRPSLPEETLLEDLSALYTTLPAA